MITRAKRGSFADDCLLASFTLAVASCLAALFAGAFSWRGELGFMLVPAVFLCRHARYRAASMSAAVALLAGVWILVPPRWSFRIDASEVPAVVIFAAAAMLAITLAARISQRKPTPSAC